MTLDPKHAREARAPIVIALLAAAGLMILGHNARAASAFDASVARDGDSHGIRAVRAPGTRFEARPTAHAAGSDAEAILGEGSVGSRVEATRRAPF